MRLNEIYKAYKDRMHFYVIYIREAHPDDGWRVQFNLDANIHVLEPRTDDERTAVAATCQVNLDLQMPLLIDNMDNGVEEKYIAMPMRLYLIDRDGRIANHGAQGPFGFDTEDWVKSIEILAGP